MAIRFSGRSAIAVKWFICVGLLTAGWVAGAAEAPVPSMPTAVLIPPEAEAPYQVATEGDQKVRWLDTAVFTEITPLSVPDIAVKLPEDQKE